MIERAAFEVAYWNWQACRDANINPYRVRAAYAEMKAAEAALDAAEAFATELTATGEQYVIPGCEANTFAQSGEQLSLF